MSSYATERQYSAGQRRALITEHLILTRRITAKEAARLAGIQERMARRILCDISGVLCLSQAGGVWFYRAHEDEDSLLFGR